MALQELSRMENYVFREDLTSTRNAVVDSLDDCANREGAQHQFYCAVALFSPDSSGKTEARIPMANLALVQDSVDRSPIARPQSCEIEPCRNLGGPFDQQNRQRSMIMLGSRLRP